MGTAARVIAIANQKGGVGKTTTTINLGAALAEQDKNTLLIDCDPQGALSVGLGLPVYDLDVTLFKILTDSSYPLLAVTHHIRRHLDLVPSNIDLASAELYLVGTMRPEYVLSDAIAYVRERYDFILLDCAASLGLLTVNALVSADEVIVPLQCEFLALRGLDALVDSIARVRQQFNPKLQLFGILPTMYNSERKDAQDILKKAIQNYPKEVLNLRVEENVRFAEAQAERRTILELDGESESAAVYRALATAVINGRETEKTASASS